MTTTPDRSWRIVRVTHTTWAQHTVSTHTNQTVAQTLAALYAAAGWVARLWGRRATYEAWRDA